MAKNEYPGVREKRGSIQIHWMHEGRRKFKSLNIPYSPANIKKAYRIRQQFIDADRAGRVEEELTNPTFGSLAQLLLDTASISKATREKYRHMLNHHWGWAFEIKIGEITQSLIRANFKNFSHSEKHKKAVLSGGSQVFQIALEDPQIDCSLNPTNGLTRKIKTPKKLPDPFSAKERDQLLGELKSSNKLFYLIRFYAGLRPGETIALTWKDYVDGNFLITKTRSKSESKNTTKTLRDRVVPVHPKIRQALQNTTRQLHDNHIVINRYGHGYSTYETFAKSLNIVMRRLEIRYRPPYNARHTCATTMLESGMQPAYCAQVLGHSLKEFLTTYARWIDQDKSAEQAKIWASID